MFFVFLFLCVLVLSPVERLGSEVKRLEEEGEFLHRLIANRDVGSALGSGE